MKENKGITLIALVVTIIILLILAGVSITTLSGNGLFGRAESSAAKYQQASENENSTISSLMDKYDNYESQVTNQITVSWASPIAEMGSFINSLTPESSRNSNFYDKEVMLIKPNGEKQLLNPYQATSVKVPDGTKLRFYFYVDKNSTYTYTAILDQLSEAKIASIKLAAYTPPTLASDISDSKDGSLHYMEITVTGRKEIKFRLVDDEVDTWTTVDEVEESEYDWTIKAYDGEDIVEAAR